MMIPKLKFSKKNTTERLGSVLAPDYANKKINEMGTGHCAVFFQFFGIYNVPNNSSN